MGWGPGFGGGRGAIWVRGWAVVSQGNGQKTAGRADGPGVGWGGILGWEALGAEKEAASGKFFRPLRPPLPTLADVAAGPQTARPS